MSLCVLDTDTLTLYYHGEPTVVQRVDARPPTDLAISVMTVDEQLTGWYTLTRQARQPDEIVRAYAHLGEAVVRLARWRLSGQLWAATYVLLGLRHSPAVAHALLQGVRSMKESTTYQAIAQEGLAEGAVQEARKLLLRLGSKQFGSPSARMQAALTKITDLDRLETLIERLGTVESWHALMAQTKADR